MNRLFTIASTGIIAGFAIGMHRAMAWSNAHCYLRYKLFHLFLIYLRTYLNKWMVMSICVAVSLYLLWYVGKFPLRWIWRAFMARYLEVRLKEWPILKQRLFAFSVATLLLLLGLYLFNYLYPCYRYSPTSVSGDIFILLGAVFVGFILARKKEARLSIIIRRLKWGRGLRVIGLALILLLFALNGYLAIKCIFFPPGGPNIVMICVDALRADHLSCYGYERQTSPNIDHFAGEAQIFGNAISQCSWTSPSVASTFTSLYPSTHGVTAYWGRKNNRLRNRFVLLAEVLKDKGYSTGAFVANHFISKKLNFGQGFDTFDQINAEYKPKAEAVNRQALNWLSGHKGGPFFLYIHYMDVHGPYKPPAPYDSLFKADKPRKMSELECMKMAYLFQDEITDLNYYIDQYDGEIKYVDYCIGELLQWLKENALFDSSIIIITSDHGEEFFEHGWCNHGLTLYNELIRVPLIVRFPRLNNPAGYSEMLIQLVDIGPSILDFMGARFPYSVHGRSFLSLDKVGEAGGGEKTAYSEEHEWQDRWKSPPKVAMIENDYKYIFHTRDGKVVELYDLRKDPGELYNLADVLNEKADAGTERITAWLEERQREASKMFLSRQRTVETADDNRAALRALGYI